MHRSRLQCVYDLVHRFHVPQVILNRLSWQRVWTIPPLESAVGSLAWRPDGRGVQGLLMYLGLFVCLFVCLLSFSAMCFTGLCLIYSGPQYEYYYTVYV